MYILSDEKYVFAFVTIVKYSRSNWTKQNNFASYK